jgi:hypothetical protein
VRRTAGTTLLLALAATLASGCGGDDGAERGDDGRVLEAGAVSVFELLQGDCLSPPEEVQAGLENVDVVPCADPHTQEVFEIIQYEPEEEGDDDFPGDSELDNFAQAACLDPFTDYVDVDYIDSSLFITYLLPTVRSWNEEGDREVICIAQTTGEQIQGSVEGSQR